MARYDNHQVDGVDILPVFLEDGILATRDNLPRYTTTSDPSMLFTIQTSDIAKSILVEIGNVTVCKHIRYKKEIFCHLRDVLSYKDDLVLYPFAFSLSCSIFIY